MKWLILCTTLILGASAENALQVQTTSGTVQGRVLHEGAIETEVFQGIPYGVEPTGDLRFAPPVAFHKEGIIDATAPGHSCPQLTTGFEEDVAFVRGPEGETEDCLNLNVWTPHPRPEKAAVLVFIHGGIGLATGSAAEPQYDGAALASSEGIIVVSINYRLAELGFMYMGTADAPGNVGAMDQTLALKWVKDNIEHFGGDPSQITLFGDTSGSWTVGFHMLLPSSKGLFQRAILLDGVPNLPRVVHTKEESLKLTYDLAKEAGCSDPHLDQAATLTCLRGKSLSELITATIKSVLSNHQVFLPVIDGVFLPEHPKVLMKSGSICHHVDVMIGSTYNRGFFTNRYIIHQKLTEEHVVTTNDLETLIKAIVPGANEYLRNIIKFHYTSWKHPECPKAIRYMAIDLTSDYYVLCPANQFAYELTKSGNDVYRFHMDFQKESATYPKWGGFLENEHFDVIFGHATTIRNYTEAEVELSHNIMDSLGRFVKTGNPNQEGHHDWPRYSVRGQSYIRVQPGTKLGGKLQTHLGSHHCPFWFHGYPKAKMGSEIMESKHCH